MSLEKKVHSALMNFPGAKKVVKRVYQGANVAVFRPKKSDGNIERVTPDDEYEYLFGYYDKSPWDASDRYMLCLRVKNASLSVAPADEAEIVLIDTEKDNFVKVIAKTHTWNVQQGCMAGWLGPSFDKEIFYNDFRDGKFCGVVLNVKTGKERLLEMPVYAVSNDGKIALSLDFSRLHRLRPGYGYSNLDDVTRCEKVPEGPCVWKIDMKSGKVQPILNYKELYDFEHRVDMEGAEHKVNHLMLSPNGKRFMVIHRWLNGGKKTSRLLTCDVNGKNLYNLVDEDMVSHCYWKNDREILAYCRRDGENGYYLLKDKTQDFERKWEWLTADGHPSYSPDGNFVVTDTYPNRKRICTLRVLSDTASFVLAKVYAPFKYDNDVRCDLHPRWSRDGKKICFDGCMEGKRGVYAVEVEDVVSEFKNKPRTEDLDLVSCVIPTYRRCDTIERAVDSVLNQTYKKIEVLVVDDNIVGSRESEDLEKVMMKYRGDKRVRLLKQPKHINGAAARNFGIRHAKGKFIAFLDDDDEWCSEKIERQLPLFSSDYVGTVTCYWNSYRNNKIIKTCPQYNANNMQFKILSRAVSIFTSTTILRKSLIEEFGGFNESLKRHQDLQLLTDASDRMKLAVLPEYLTKLHVDSDINRPKLRDFINCKKQFLELERSKINNYGFIKRRRIYGAHNFEIIFLALKEKNIVVAIMYGFRVCFNVFAIYDVVIRMVRRKTK